MPRLGRVSFSQPQPLARARVSGRAVAPGYSQDEPEDDDECLDVIHLYLSPVWDIGHALFWPGEISAPAPRAIDELSCASSVPIGPRASLGGPFYLWNIPFEHDQPMKMAFCNPTKYE